MAPARQTPTANNHGPRSDLYSIIYRFPDDSERLAYFPPHTSNVANVNLCELEALEKILIELVKIVRISSLDWQHGLRSLVEIRQRMYDLDNEASASKVTGIRGGGNSEKTRHEHDLHAEKPPLEQASGEYDYNTGPEVTGRMPTEETSHCPYNIIFKDIRQAIAFQEALDRNEVEILEHDALELKYFHKDKSGSVKAPSADRRLDKSKGRNWTDQDAAFVDEVVSVPARRASSAQELLQEVLLRKLTGGSGNWRTVPGPYRDTILGRDMLRERGFGTNGKRKFNVDPPWMLPMGGRWPSPTLPPLTAFPPIRYANDPTEDRLADIYEENYGPRDSGQPLNTYRPSELIIPQVYNMPSARKLRNHLDNHDNASTSLRTRLRRDFSPDQFGIQTFDISPSPIPIPSLSPQPTTQRNRQSKAPSPPSPRSPTNMYHSSRHKSIWSPSFLKGARYTVAADLVPRTDTPQLSGTPPTSRASSAQDTRRAECPVMRKKASSKMKNKGKGEYKGKSTMYQAYAGDLEEDNGGRGGGDV